MTFFDFLEKHKKIVFLIVIVISAAIIGVLISTTFGGIAGLVTALFGFITGKKEKGIEEHEKAQQALDRQIQEVIAREEEVIKQISESKVKEKQIRQDIKTMEEKYNQMSLSDKIKEHNKSLGY